MNLDALKRFENSEENFKLTKIASKRPNAMVDVGMSQIGNFNLHTYPAADDNGRQTGVVIFGKYGNFLITSPIVKILDHDESSTTFETEGGVYRLEKYEE